MDTVLTIFKSLDIDQTFFVQLVLIVILYLILRNLLFSKLQEVLDLREEKTTKMEGGAQAKLAQAEKLAEQYKESIDKARGQALSIISAKKDEVQKREAEKVKALDAKLENELNAKREEFSKELESKKESIMQQADSLSQDLVTKIVQ